MGNNGCQQCLARSAGHGSAPTDLALDWVDDLWALMPLARDWARVYVGSLLRLALWSTWSHMSCSDWLELRVLDDGVPFSCKFNLNSPAHNFHPTSVEFVNILSYANNNSLLCMDFLQDLTVKMGQNRLSTTKKVSSVTNSWCSTLEHDS